MTYQGNPKHKEPWQPGRRGSLCPRDVDLTLAQQLLDGSIHVGAARFAAWQGQAFCAREHQPDTWHGYPVQWHEVPPPVRNQWVCCGLVSRSDIRDKW